MPLPLVGAASASETETLLLSWRIHRLRDSPSGIALVAGGYAAAMVVWWLLFPYPLALFLPTIALTSALGEYLFPIDYKLTSRGVYARCGPLSRLFLPWSDVRRASRGKDGVFLSSLKLPSRLDQFRGIRLHFGEGNAELVVDIVKRMRDAAHESVVGTPSDMAPDVIERAA